MTIRPFWIDWSAQEIDRVIDRVAATRLPWTPPGAGWSLGCDAQFLAKLQAYWVDEYDTAAAVASLNRFPQFIATLAGQDIHFVHVQGESAQARPLILTHGWPGSHFEFWSVIDALTSPSQHGGRSEDAFELVIPSLPGFGFSGKPTTLVGPRATARLWNTLMTRELGFAKYFAQGGDWGAVVTTWLGAEHPAVGAIHLNMLCLQRRGPPNTAEEESWARAQRRNHDTMGDYVCLQTRKPQSIALATADNPLGQAAWIIERMHDWTDLDGRELDEVFSLDQLITNAMIYIMTGSFASAAWFYHASAQEQASDATAPVSRAPTAFAAFPGDPMSLVPPRSRATGVYDIQRWSEQPRGGHFAALQEPALFVDDLRAWARSCL